MVASARSVGAGPPNVTLATVVRCGRHHRDGAHHGLVDRRQTLLSKSGQPDQDAEPVQSAVVLPRSAGDLGLLRSLVRRSGVAEPHHRGLMVIPYVDNQSQGNGYYCYRDRNSPSPLFLFGFLVIGSRSSSSARSFRGPVGTIFAGQYWDVHKTVAITNVNLATSSAFTTSRGPRCRPGCLFGVAHRHSMAFWRRASKRARPCRSSDGALSITAQLFHDHARHGLEGVSPSGFNVKY